MIRVGCSPDRWLLQAFVITAMISIGNTYDLCEKFDTFDFESKKQCIQAANNLGESLKNTIKSSKDVLDIVSHKVRNKFGSIFMHLVLSSMAKQKNVKNGTLTDTAQFLSHKGLPQKETVTLREVNQESGFDLTKEEITKFKMWDKGVIPYFIDEYSFDKVLRDRIRFILDEVNAATNLQFMEIPRPPDDDTVRYVFFINRRGTLKCVDHSSKDFSNQGLQKVILGYDCINLNSGMASLILTLVGVPPQHNAPNRDEYIVIVKESIMPDKVKLFTKLKDEDWLFHDVDYDFESASHYHYHKYSVKGRSTILPVRFHVEAAKVGEDKTFSYSDLLKIKMLYNYISRNPHSKKVECSQMFQPGRDINKYKPSKNSPKPRKKPTQYTEARVSKEVESAEDDNSTGAAKLNLSNDEIDNHNNYSGIDNDNKDYERPEKLAGHRGPMSAESQKRLKLKQLIQNESDFHTEEDK